MLPFITKFLPARKAALILLFFVFIVGESMAQNADVRILRNIHLSSHPRLDNGMRFMSQSVAPLSIGVPAGILIYNLAKKPGGQQAMVPFIVGGSVVATSAICLGLKFGVNRPRPFVTYPDIEQRDQHAGPYSFPSAHTGNAFALATSLSLCYPKWYVIAPAFTWAVGVGYARMRLGVHYPTDVLMGAIIGAGCAWASYEIGNYLREKSQ